MAEEPRREWTDPRYAELVAIWQRAREEPLATQPNRGFITPKPKQQ
ncbi:hypothetical protein [Streptomyces sp. NBC_00648]